MKLNAIECSRLVKSALLNIPIEDRAETIHFAVDREEETVIVIENKDVTEDSLDVGDGYLYRVLYANTKSYVISLM